MSIAINNSHEIDYNVIVSGNKPPTATYMERIYLAWINSVGQVRPQSEFAEILGMDRQRFNNYYNGKRTNMDYVTAQRVGQIAAGFGADNPYEILEILGFPRPVSEDPLSKISPEFSETLQAALKEINEKIDLAGVEADSPEAWEIARSVLSRIGLAEKPKR